MKGGNCDLLDHNDRKSGLHHSMGRKTTGRIGYIVNGPKHKGKSNVKKRDFSYKVRQRTLIQAERKFC